MYSLIDKTFRCLLTVKNLLKNYKIVIFQSNGNIAVFNSNGMIWKSGKLRPLQNRMI